MLNVSRFNRLYSYFVMLLSPILSFLFNAFVFIFIIKKIWHQEASLDMSEVKFFYMLNGVDVCCFKDTSVVFRVTFNMSKFLTVVAFDMRRLMIVKMAMIVI